jgi:hypothetical protein
VKPLAQTAVSSAPEPDAESVDRAAIRPSALVRLRRRWRPILIAAAALGALAWSAMWIVTAQTMSANLADWLAQEQEAGRNWTCADHAFGGFPLRIEASCSGPRLQASIGDAVVSGTVHKLRATAQVFAPHMIAVSVEGPLDLQSSDRQHLHAAWKSLAVNLTFGLYGINQAQVLADSPQISADAPQFEAFSADAGRAEAEFSAIAGQPFGEVPYSFSLRIADCGLAALDRLFGSADPATIETEGTVHHLEAAGAGDLAAIAESWQLSGGRIDLAKADLRKGAAEIRAAGHLDIDDGHRLGGSFDVSGVGLEPILARYGVPSSALAVNGLLTSLFASSAAPGDPAPTLSAPVKLQNGRVFVGPVQLPFTLEPLY